MTIQDLREKRSKALHDAQAIKAAGEFTTESRAKFDAFVAEADGVEADIKRLERVEAYEAEQRSRKEHRPAPGAGEDRATLEKRAFAEFLKFGKHPEQRDLLTINANGQALIPQAYAPSIVEAQKAWGGLVNVVDEWLTDNGAPMKTSLVNDTTNLMAPVTEGTAAGESDPSTNSILISTDELMSTVKVSIAELQDASFDVDAWLRKAFGPRYFRGLSSLIANGSTSGNIQSIITGYSTGAVQTAAVGTVGYADLAKIYGALDPAYIESSTWVMNSNTRALLMGETDTLGRPLFIPSPNAGGFDTLLGRPVVISQYHQGVASGNTAIQFGDFKSGYKLRTVKPGLTVLRLNERFADALEVGFVGYSRNGGAVTDAGTHPIVSLKVQ